MMDLPVVVLISANLEWQAILHILLPKEILHSPYGEYFVREVMYKNNTIPVIFMHGGFGKIAAAASTQYVIDRWHPDLLVNLGTCGGFEGHVKKGDLFLVDKTIAYDIVERMGDAQEAIDHYTTIVDLSWLDEPYPQSVKRRLLVSADRDLDIEEIPFLNAKYGAEAGDWESAAIAYVADKNHTHCLILRGVTDVVSQQGSPTYGSLDVFATEAEAVMQSLITALPLWLERYPF
jgi:adenosylhomocysteine nucleosidase